MEVVEDSVSRKLKLAYKKYEEGFLGCKGEKMAELAGGVLEDDEIVIRHFATDYRVKVSDCSINPKPESLLEEILILKYLQEAVGQDGPGKEFLAFQQLPCGGHHIKAFKAEVTDPLAKRFGADFEGFKRACEALGGVPAKDGDISYILPFFPKIYVKVIIWEADDEFPAAAQFLFDNKCTFHMDTDGLNELANSTAERLISL